MPSGKSQYTIVAVVCRKYIKEGAEQKGGYAILDLPDLFGPTPPNITKIDEEDWERLFLPVCGHFGLPRERNNPLTPFERPRGALPDHWFVSMLYPIQFDNQLSQLAEALKSHRELPRETTRGAIFASGGAVLQAIDLFATQGPLLAAFMHIQLALQRINSPRLIRYGHSEMMDYINSRGRAVGST